MRRSLLKLLRRCITTIVPLLLLLTACDLTVKIGTDVNADGSGEFTLAIALDRELVEGLAEAGDATGGVSSLDELFGGLARAGWITSRSEPSGGLLLQGRRAFTDSDDFDRALRELAGAGAGEEQPLNLGGSLLLDHEVDDSFLRTGATFGGSIDLTFGDDPPPLLVQLEDLLRQRVHIEIAAELPGSISIQEGGGSVEGERVVWRPVIGQRTTFAATASKVKSAVLLALMVPGLALLAVAAWLLMGRGRKRGPDELLDPVVLLPDEPIDTPTV